MKIISHRGYWRTADEKNSVIAFKRSFDLGYGIETDVRDFNKELVISHDMPCGDEITLKDLLKLLDGRDLPLALNIKSDGLADKMSQILNEANISNSFVFDMSTPDQLSYIKNGQFTVYTRMSEYERDAALYEECDGIWLDGFSSTWYDMGLILDLLHDNKQVCIVSPELHRRSDHNILWHKMKNSNISKSDNIILCTDFPEDAASFFEEDL